MPVLDIRDAVSIEKPRTELDPLLKRGRVEPRPRHQGMVEQNRAEIVLHAVPVELDVVITMHERERVPLGDEPRELGEDVRVPDRHAL